jgi:hypothetical protein
MGEPYEPEEQHLIALCERHMRCEFVDWALQ